MIFAPGYFAFKRPPLNFSTRGTVVFRAPKSLEIDGNALKCGLSHRAVESCTRIIAHVECRAQSNV